MMKKYIVLAVCLGMVFKLSAQELDTVLPVHLNEIIVVGYQKQKQVEHNKPLGSLDSYLEQSDKVTMIKRGNYAWEPAINNMVTDRIAVTIDGMQIFGACTDKMDPITSYVDISNLSEVHISSGQQGSENGATIGGGMDMKLKKGTFESNHWQANLDTGFESNGNASVLSAAFNFNQDNWYVNADIMHRKSGNYYAGGNEEVEFSQYEKYNISTLAGYKINSNNAIHAALIYDNATDIGYPALPMDVSLARAVIGSLSWVKTDWNKIEEWETKVYANSIKHVMDDSQRPVVPVRMDMPGWSDTYGFYSKAHTKFNNHHVLANINGYYNKSLAEMTMYPNNPNESEMYMLTWPDVRTTNTGIYVEDKISLKNKQSLLVSGRAGYQYEHIASEFGLNSLRIFYPEMADHQSRTMFSVSAKYEKNLGAFDVKLGGGYGQRAPSVSESYGFYLFNSFDNFDYLGNPYLDTENAFEINAGLGFEQDNLKLSLDGSWFYMDHYIIGQIDPTLSPMTIGATGVKVYKALDHAQIITGSLNGSYQFLEHYEFKGQVGHSFGQDNLDNHLPLISPLNYNLAINFHQGMFHASAAMEGADQQSNYAPDYGEMQTKAYQVYHVNASYNFYFGQQKLITKLGVENIFDKYYSTYADWNHIPRMGRNVFINLSYLFK